MLYLLGHNPVKIILPIYFLLFVYTSQTEYGLFYQDLTYIAGSIIFCVVSASIATAITIPLLKSVFKLYYPEYVSDNL